MDDTQSVVPGGDLWGHPKGLYILFFSEMWERFCYYGMRCILVYYMMKELLFAQDKASHIYGLYTSASFFMPLFGGMIADKFLGQRKCVLIGAIIMAIGEFVLMSPSLFYPGLTLMALGVGLFKPNVSTQVGTLYKHGDHRRDRAFNIFYMGINVGAILSPFICGTLGELYGWKYGFMSAGIGVLLGLIVYIWGQKYLAPDLIMQKTQKKEPVESRPMTKDDWVKLLMLAIVCVLNIVFWGAYEQQGNTQALWVDSNTNRMILGWEMPATWYQNFNPIMLLLIIPPITWFWGKLDKIGREPSSIGKMGIACFLMGVSFLFMLPAVWEFNRTGTSSLMWLTISTLILSIAEVYLSPVGLSLVTKLAPPKLISSIMGIWFVAVAGGEYFAGFLGTFYEKMPKDHFFGMIALICIVTGSLLLIILKPLKRIVGHGHAETVDA